MKKLLTIIFMAALTISAFATVDLQTTNPTVDHQGACERVGQMKFIVSNTQDYQGLGTNEGILIKVQLSDGATLCHDIGYTAGNDNGFGNWARLEIENHYWYNLGDVLAKGNAGDDFFYILITRSPDSSTGELPSQNTAFPQAWFSIGTTQSVGQGSLYGDDTPICINFDGSSLGNNDWFKVSVSDFTVDYAITGYDPGDPTANPVVPATPASITLTNMQVLGTSYQPSDPAIAYGLTGEAHNFVVDSNCNPKTGSDFNTPDVKLCQCYVPTTEQQADGTYVTTYDCKDLYRIGTLDLDTPSCDVWLEEDGISMLPANSTVTMTVVDASGAPIDVAFASVPSLTPMVLSDGTTPAELSLGGATAGAAVTGTYANTSYNGYIPTDGVCDTDGKDQCVTNAYSLYDSYSWTVGGNSVTEPARIQIGDVDLARNTADGPVTAYLKISWTPYPCGTGGSVILTNFPINFVDCPPEATVDPVYYPAYEYFTYFPALNGQWWAGLAVTNVTYFNENFVPVLHGVMDQDADVVLYLIEADGDVYMANVGTLPKSGILVTLLSDPAFAPTPVTKSDTTFGDEPFWVIAEATPTIANTWMAIDGFGMLGDGNQGQGTLPRIDTPYSWWTSGNLFNK